MSLLDISCYCRCWICRSTSLCKGSYERISVLSIVPPDSSVKYTHDTFFNFYSICVQTYRGSWNGWEYCTCLCQWYWPQNQRIHSILYKMAFTYIQWVWSLLPNHIGVTDSLGPTGQWFKSAGSLDIFVFTYNMAKWFHCLQNFLEDNGNKYIDFIMHDSLQARYKLPHQRVIPYHETVQERLKTLSIVWNL